MKKIDRAFASLNGILDTLSGDSIQERVTMLENSLHGRLVSVQAELAAQLRILDRITLALVRLAEEAPRERTCVVWGTCECDDDSLILPSGWERIATDPPRRFTLAGAALRLPRGGSGMVHLDPMLAFHNAILRVEEPFVISDVIVGRNSQAASLPGRGEGPPAAREFAFSQRVTPGTLITVHVEWPVSNRQGDLS